MKKQIGKKARTASLFYRSGLLKRFCQNPQFQMEKYRQGQPYALHLFYLRDIRRFLSFRERMTIIKSLREKEAKGLL